MALSFPLSASQPVNRFLLASALLLPCLFLLSALFLPRRSPLSPFSLSFDLSLPPSPSPPRPPPPSLYHPPPLSARLGPSSSEPGPAEAAGPREVDDGVMSLPELLVWEPEPEAAPDLDAAEARESRPAGRREGKCDLYQGRWERDEEGWYPLYSPASCPYVDEAFSCQENGRPDRDYLKWRWTPKDCDLPR